ncbi:hypothetical protein DBR42_29525 [Pelomonas sp. HMWF004]|nr:hypothetical protein DBR42_29525 [Pelomonas sp. HMWF004]
MTLHRLPIILWLAAGLAACAVAPLEVLPPASLASTAPWAVSGRQGWTPNRALRFGDYSTRDLAARERHRTATCPGGCTHVDLGLYQRRYDDAIRTATQQLRFTLVGPAGAEADVQLTSRLDQHQREWITRWFGIPTDFGGDFTRQVSVVGTVQPADASQPGWRFALRDDGTLPLQAWAEDDTGRRLTLAPLQQFKGRDGRAMTMPGFASASAFGYAFELDGQAVAAVATAGAGTVWISPAVTPELRLSLAGLASALLLRPTMSH